MEDTTLSRSELLQNLDALIGQAGSSSGGEHSVGELVTNTARLSVGHMGTCN